MHILSDASCKLSDYSPLSLAIYLQILHILLDSVELDWVTSGGSRRAADRASPGVPRRAVGAAHAQVPRGGRSEENDGHDGEAEGAGENNRRPSDVRAVLDLIRQRNVQVVDVKFCDLPGTWQHFSIPAATLNEDMVKEGLGFDGSSIRGFQAINESDMLLMPDLSTAFVDPVLAVPTLSLDLRHLRSAHARALLPRSPLHCVQGRGVPEDDRHRDGIVLGAGSRVLHLQLGAVRPERPRGVLPHRLRGGHLELGPERDAQPRAPAPAQGGLLPGAAGRPAAGRALEDHAGADRGRDSGRGAAPRGGHGGPGRDRHPVRAAGADGRPAADLQVHRQERLPRAGLHGHVHAQAALRRQRLGHALPPVALEGRPAAVLRRERLCRSLRDWPGTTSAA